MQLKADAKRYSWGVERLLLFMMVLIVSPGWSRIKELCETQNVWRESDDTFITRMKELHEQLMAVGRFGDRKAKKSDYRCRTYIHSLCGRGVYPPKITSREEVESRLSSAIERKYRRVGDTIPTKSEGRLV